MNPPNNENALSKPFGDAVVCSILAAVKVFVDNKNNNNGLTDPENTMSLNSLFVVKFSDLNAHFLDTDTPEEPYQPKPKANLGRLQALLQRGSLVLNMTTFQCTMFDRSDEWFLCRQRYGCPVVTELPRGLGPILIDYVVVSLQAWHYNNREKEDHFSHLMSAEKHWSRLAGLLGPGLYTTKIHLDWDEERKALVRSEDGMPIQAWALSCPRLPKIAHHITNMILNGSWDDDDTSSDDGDSKAKGTTSTTDNAKQERKPSE